MTFLFHAGSEIEIEIERSARAKRIRIKIDRANRRAVLVLTKRGSEKSGLEFAQSKVDWIARQLSRLPDVKIFSDGMPLTFLDKDLVIHHSPTARRGVWISDNVIWVSGQPEHLARRVRDFLKEQARLYAQQKVFETAAALQVKISKITIRDTTSRWGSCNREGNISLSWRLGFAPRFVFDYVIAHEVSHLKQMNHSAAFWKTVSDLDPRYVEAERWLKQNAAYLYSFTTTL